MTPQNCLFMHLQNSVAFVKDADKKEVMNLPQGNCYDGENL